MKKSSIPNAAFPRTYALGFALVLLVGGLFFFNSKDKTGHIPSTQMADANPLPVATPPNVATSIAQIEAKTPKPVAESSAVRCTIPALIAKAGTPPPQYFGLREGKKSKTLEDRASSVGDRLKFEFDMLKDPATGKIPRFAREKATEAAVETPSYASLWGAESIPGMTLTAKGPTNLGGKTRALGIDVNDANIMMAGSTSSGLFRTTNGGTSWTRVTPTGEMHSVTCIAQDTRAGQTNTWYYGSGESSGNSASLTGADFYLGFGIWKSADNGVTWVKLAATAVTLESFNSPFDFVHKLIVDPTNGNVYAAAGNSIRRSTDGGTTWGLVCGFFSNSAYADVIVTPTGRFYGAIAGDGGSNEGIWTSTTGASGSWTKIAGTISSVVTPAAWHAAGAYGRIVLAYAPSSTNIVYALYWNGTSHTSGAPSPEAKLFKFDQTTTTWTDLSANLPDEAGYSQGNDPFACQGGYDLCIAVKPNDINTVFVGGTNVYRSTNGFTSTAATTRIGGYANTSGYALYSNHHPDIHTFIFAAGDNNTLYTGDDGGIHKGDITAGTVAWTSLNNDYVTYMYYHVDIAPSTGSGDIVVGGAQDNGTTLSTAGTTYDAIWGGDGVAVGFISYTNSTTFNIIAGSQNGSLRRITTPNSGINIRPSGASSIFVTYFHLDPDNISHLYYAGATTLYRTRTANSISSTTITGDAITGWQQMTGTITGNIRCLATARDNAYGGLDYNASDANRRLFIGTESGTVYRLNDPAFTAASTVPVDITPVGSSGLCSSISVNPTDYNEILVTFSNYGVNSVYHTSNAQSATPTWTNVEGPAAGAVALSSARSSVIAKSDNTTYYLVGTSTGLYYASALSGATTAWTKIGATEINHAVVSHMRYRTGDNKIAVGTHGNGMFLLTIPNSVLPIELLTLTGKGEKEGNRLSWTTAQERDMDGFEVQRSNTGEKNSFENIGFIKANNGMARQSYNFLDTKASATAPQYYRLKAVEKTAAKSAFTKIVTIEAAAKRAALDFVVAPNPVSSDMQLVFDNEPLPNFTVNVMDYAGRIVRTRVVKNLTDKSLTLSMSNLASGTYFVSIISPTGSIKTMKFFKL